MSQPVLRKLLEDALKTVPGIPAYIAWENVLFEPPTKLAWVRPTVKILSERAAAIGVGSKTHVEGLFLVDIFTPANKGPQSGETLAQAIKDAFPRGDLLTASGQRLHISRSESGSAMEEEQWFQIPVKISWYAYV